ncbi:hypothetical protein K402DRAFT_467938 [Aulographum hederae CBS 113979]|uniref:SnoaL-like domain-containing protein n=1 Tax=Aulographum hederae CBS 113979 TaxID=1176131 RepID=A0A6G1GJ47_9PEZI|nr:hypothetical protein K402DRAFT_467938 [Aulographum hederae CBS 113979]
MSSDPIKKTYFSYIASLNRRQLSSLSNFFHDTLSYNNKTLSLADFQTLLSEQISRTPDVQFIVRNMLCEDDGKGNGMVAARFVFSVTPVGREFMGLELRKEGEGEKGEEEEVMVEFAEHVWYWFEKGKVRRVQSLVGQAKKLEGW